MSRYESKTIIWSLNVNDVECEFRAQGWEDDVDDEMYDAVRMSIGEIMRNFPWPRALSGTVSVVILNSKRSWVK